MTESDKNYRSPVWGALGGKENSTCTSKSDRTVYLYVLVVPINLLLNIIMLFWRCDSMCGIAIEFRVFVYNKKTELRQKSHLDCYFLLGGYLMFSQS